MVREERYDVVIIGTGLAGLALCRQLLMRSPDKRVLLVDNRSDLPGPKQKVGESLVQVAGYYFTRILDLEEHLLQAHYPKYNLRFYWKTAGRDNRSLEDYSHSYIGKVSNVATYHLNRNSIEAFLLDWVARQAGVTLHKPALALQVEFSEEDGPHRVRFGLDGETIEAQAPWIVDTSGRTQLFKKKRDIRAENSIRHGSSWCWVEGLVNVEKLTGTDPEELRRRRDAKKQGLLPIWLATNHFCGEGFWFWVIPLKGLTSLGVVYDSALFPAESVSTPERLLAWACREFPLFERDLPNRRILDSARLLDYSYDCRQTLNPAGWAISGFAGRFSDPLYSPGSDLIAYYNTWIVDAMLETDREARRLKCEMYEALMKVVYEAYVPSYSISYGVLGDPETFTFKYAWELAIYFAFYAFPFINGLFTNPRYVRFFFRKFSQLGPINRNLQEVLARYFEWKKGRDPLPEPVAKDFTDLGPLKKAEMSYYRTGLGIDAAEEELESQLRNMKEMARYIYAFIASAVLEAPAAVLNRDFVAGIKLSSFRFDPGWIREQYGAHALCRDRYEWSFDPRTMDVYRPGVLAAPVPA